MNDALHDASDEPLNLRPNGEMAQIDRFKLVRRIEMMNQPDRLGSLLINIQDGPPAPIYALTTETPNLPVDRDKGAAMRSRGFSCPKAWFADNGERLGTYSGRNGAMWCCDVSLEIFPSLSFFAFLFGCDTRARECFDFSTHFALVLFY